MKQLMPFVVALLSLTGTVLGAQNISPSTHQSEAIGILFSQHRIELQLSFAAISYPNVAIMLRH
jgi:hypothetical protein